MSVLHAAVAQFADTIVGDYPGESFTCSEINALATVLLAGGFPDEAHTLLMSHVGGEDDYDAHYAFKVEPSEYDEVPEDNDTRPERPKDWKEEHRINSEFITQYLTTLI